MKYDSDEMIINKALNTIHTPEYNIDFKVKEEIKNKKSYVYLKKTRPIVLAVSLCLILTIGVAAATIPSINNLLSIVSPDIALLLQPIGIISEDNGIKMEVVAAMNDDEMAVVYFTMQDLTGNRIDDTLDIYNYSFNGARMFNIQVVNYDESTKTATLRMQANGGKKLNGKKVSFRMDSFLSDKIIFNEIDTKVNLSDIIKTNTLQVTPLDMNNISGGGGDLYKEFEKKGIINVLKPDEMNISIPNIDFMHISNIGYIEDNLHIQTKWVGDGIDDHGGLYFIDTLGNDVNTNAANIYFGTDKLGNTEYGHDYVEYIFDMKDINLDEIRLMGYFVSNNKYTEGNWKTTFKLLSVKETKKITTNIKLDTLTINKVSVSPIGITLLCNGDIEKLEKINVKANMVDGSVKTFESFISYGEVGETKLKFTSSLSLDVAKVESVSINDIVINLND